MRRFMVPKLRRGNHNYIVTTVICYLMLFNPAFAADALHEVMDALSRVERSEVRYQEEKHLGMLDLPLVQTGTLSYIAPDRFSRSMDGPAASRFTVHGDQVTLEKMTGKEIHDLNNLPMIKAFIASFGATLAGDLATLQQYYEISFDGAQNDWRLDLQPRSTRLASYVTRIQLWGSYDRIKGMEIRETNGDWSQMIMLHE